MRFHKYYFYLLFIISRESASCFFHTIHSFFCIFGLYEPQTREDFCHFTPPFAPFKRRQCGRTTQRIWVIFLSLIFMSSMEIFMTFHCVRGRASQFFSGSRAIFHSFELRHLNDAVSTTLFHFPFSLLSSLSLGFFLCGH